MTPVELRLHFLTTEPLAGRIVLPDESELPFNGWAGLAGALQTAFAATTDPAQPDQSARASASPARPGTSSLP